MGLGAPTSIDMLDVLVDWVEKSEPLGNLVQVGQSVKSSGLSMVSEGRKPYSKCYALSSDSKPEADAVWVHSDAGVLVNFQRANGIA